MSAKIMGQVWDLDLPANEQSVLLAMADHADHDGNRVWPSNGLIAWKIGASEDTVIRMKRKLEERGILEIVSPRPGKTKIYKINILAGKFKVPFQPDSHDQTPRNLRPPAICDPPQSCAALPPANCGTTTRTALRPEPSEEPSVKPSLGISAEAAKTKGRKKSDDPRHHEFITEWCVAYRDSFNDTSYKVSGQDARRLSELLKLNKETTVDELISIARSAWPKRDSGQRFFGCSHSTVIASFVQWFNKIHDELTRAGLISAKGPGEWDSILTPVPPTEENP